MVERKVREVHRLARWIDECRILIDAFYVELSDIKYQASEKGNQKLLLMPMIRNYRRHHKRKGLNNHVAWICHVSVVRKNS
ncbi:hypothetical protein KIN20_028321 [Parelaphostrongylus tenuis]|uniref:Uncharacterized protein n=1 Tax=Parelaphostrongylus tenuis TaxID=148309 RepID=A0AAD5R138_PARTN|nr:hypothetical protein KIN20_028321 [Parelaphostrongylus tenuis]